MPTTIDLGGPWRLSWAPIQDAAGVPPCPSPIEGRVPGDVHDDLVRAGLLPEPLVGTNAPLHEWVEAALFAYERQFRVPDAPFDRAELVFDGIDCLAEVFIDGRLVGSSANAFVPHVFEVTPHISAGGGHSLRASVETGVVWGRAQDRKDYINGDNYERMFLRKPQFSFKWDWAPRLVTCGLWRPVRLVLHRHAAIRDVLLTSSFDGEAATLSAAVEVEAFEAGDYVVRLSAACSSDLREVEQAVALTQGRNRVDLKLLIDPVRRWFPAGYGDQPLYDVRVELSRSGEPVDVQARAYGFREIIIRQDGLEDGEPCFIVNVNGIDVFCKGANWVPADSIVARVPHSKYERLVCEAVEANFNMFRIWGGGIYEDPVFYDLCDRHGIMIWHDFMFACSEYPDDRQWFMDNVRDEAAKVVRMLRHHPSIALWCGNNENDWIYAFMVRGKHIRCEPFYGQSIYHELLPELCAQLDPQRFYWPSSPFGGDDPNSETFGDRHAWNVSILEKDLAARADIRNYRADRGRFNSEYGVISYALPRTILDYTGDRRIDFSSAAYKVHDNSFNAGVTETESLTDWYLKIAFAKPSKGGSITSDPLDYIYQSLAYQAMGYREAISDFRIRKFGCAGSLFWMYSDCWGTLGWTIIDYYLRRKPSFYWVRKAYQPLAVFVRVEDDQARTYVVNDTLEEVTVDLTLEVGTVTSPGEKSSAGLVVPANGVVIGPSLACGPGYAFAQITRYARVISDDLILTRFPSEMDVPPTAIRAKITEEGPDVVVALASDTFGHLVYLDLPNVALPSDNYFNLAPGREKVIRVTGARKSEVRVGALNAPQ